MKTLIIIMLIGLIVVAGIYCFELDRKINDDAELYHGPVPAGYDLDYFRKTGETIKEDVE